MTFQPLLLCPSSRCLINQRRFIEVGDMMI